MSGDWPIGYTFLTTKQKCVDRMDIIQFCVDGDVSDFAIVCKVVAPYRPAATKIKARTQMS